MIFSVFNDGIQWTLAFDPDSVTIAVIDLVQKIIISSQEIPLAAWHLLLPQRQNFLDNHLPRVPITQKQEGTIETRDEVLSSVGAQDLDTSNYQVSELEDMEFNWENSQLDMDALFRLGTDTIFLQLRLTIYRWRYQLKNPLCWTKRKQGGCSSSSSSCSSNTRIRQTQGTSQAAEKSRFWSMNRKCTRLCF